MPGPHNRTLIGRLAAWIVRGGSIAEFARKNKISRRTGYRWAALAECKAKVEQLRQRIFDRMVHKLTRYAAQGVDEIHRIAGKGESDAVRLSAWRSLVDKMFEVKQHADLEKRMAEIERQLRDQLHGKPDSPGGSPAGNGEAHQP
jgi:hypothetical protein